MSVHENIRIVQEYLSNHTPDYAAEDVIFHDYSQPEPVKGRQAFGQLLDAFYRTGFSDAKLEIRHIAADENCVTLEVTFHGVNTGPLRGHAPTGKRVELPVCGVYDIEDGLIRRVRIYYDNGLLERQLGWIPSQ
jgi:limonene-1,2-epoxide hydrolase